MFEKIGELRRKKREFQIFVDECSEYMLSGSYYVEVVQGKIALKRDVFLKRELKNWYYWIVCGSYRIKSTSDEINCNAVIISPFGNYKMIEEVNKKTYTLFSNEHWNKVFTFYEIMSQFFQTPIISADYKKHVLIERFLNTIEIQEPKKVFKNFCNSFLHYSSEITWNETLSVKEIKKNLDERHLKPEIRAYTDYLESKIINDTEDYPVIICHNDVHVKNFITEDNQIFNLIDFELCDKNVFFFDVLGLIINSAVFHRDKTLYDMYILGKLDQYIDECFLCYGKKYNPELKEEYLYKVLYFRMYMFIMLGREFPKSYLERSWQFENNNKLD